jgi:hypothetical protein
MRTETEILFGIIVTLAIIGFVCAYLPEQFRILSNFDFIFLSGSIVGVSAACSIITGFGCVAALGIFAIANFILYFVIPNASTFAFIKPLIVIPITLIITYIVSRLARGGG